MEVTFFKSSRGDEPVFKYMETLSETAQTKIYGRLAVLQRDGYLDMPYGKKMTGSQGLYEVRSGKHRILYCIHNGTAIMLHAFFKKTKKTPEKELKVAKKRMRLLKKEISNAQKK